MSSSEIFQRKPHVNISTVFDVFSRRNQHTTESNTPLTYEFRNRVLLLWSRVFLWETSKYFPSGPTLWSEVYDKLLYSLGRQRLSEQNAITWQNDLKTFLGDCNDKNVLDFIELSFKATLIWQELDMQTGNRVDVEALIDNLNTFLEIDGLPYYLTRFTFSDNGIETYPTFIRRDSDILHKRAIEPALSLLSASDFREANKEFRGALEDHRKGDYGDCVVKCGSSFESVMKIICEQRGWPPQRDAGKLLNTVLSKTDLPKFLKQPLFQTATIRNELGSAHGAGDSPREVSKRLAQYTINVTASAILLLVEETKP